MRKIVYHADFADQLLDAEVEFPRFEEFLRGIKHKLRTNPEFGTQVGANPPVWLVSLPDVFEKSLGVSYTFDESTVCLLSLWID